MRTKPKAKRRVVTRRPRPAGLESRVAQYGLANIQALFDAGLNATAVAKTIGVSRPTLYPALRRHFGVEPECHCVLAPVHPGVYWPDDQAVGVTTLGALRVALRGGVRIKALLEHFGCSRHDLAYPLSVLGYRLQERTRLVAAKEDR